MFEMFVQGDCSPGRFEGRPGIGLTLMHRLAEMYGGTARAHSGQPG
jgi:hypothetical protein